MAEPFSFGGTHVHRADHISILVAAVLDDSAAAIRISQLHVWQNQPGEQRRSKARARGKWGKT